MKSNIESRKWAYLTLILAIMLLSGCAYHHSSEVYSDSYGFFSGIWHGIIFPFSLIVNLISWLMSLISWIMIMGNISINLDNQISLGISIFEAFISEVQIIGRPNTGLFYYIGFFLGLSALGGAAKT
jgi:hypothetical protein